MEDEVVDQSVETNDTPVVEESAPQAEASGAEKQESSPEKQPDEKLPPFHEHPRFKEVIEQNRGYKTQLEQYQGALERLQQQMETLKQAAPKKDEPKDPFLTKLEEIDPKYAQSLQAIYGKASRVDQLEQRLAQYEQQQFAEKAVSHFNGLLDQNKITDPMDRKIYERAVRAEVYEREARGAKLNLKDLDRIVSDFHSEYKKAMEDRERAITAKYVTAKKSDVTPRSTTGGAATAPTAKKIAASDISGQAKWLADQIRQMKKTV